MRKKVYQSIFIIVVVGFGFYYYFFLYPKHLEDNIYQQKGYEVQKVEKAPIMFSLDKEWLEIPKGKTVVINKELTKSYNSTVFLDSIRNEFDNVTINFKIDHDLNYKNGKFLSFYNISNNGYELSFATKDNIFNLFDHNEQAINIMEGSRGSGPGELFSQTLKINILKLATTIELNLFLYEYEKQ